MENEAMEMTVWAAQTMICPHFGDILPNPLGWMMDIYGGPLDRYVGQENMPTSGVVVGIGAYQDGGGYFVAVRVTTSKWLAAAIDPKDIIAGPTGGKVK